jgi:hypothetical protein
LGGHCPRLATFRTSIPSQLSGAREHVTAKPTLRETLGTDDDTPETHLFGQQTRRLDRKTKRH